jgi:hypothetical protein
VASADYQVHGVVVPQMDVAVYLCLLGVLVALLALPRGLKRLAKAAPADGAHAA